MRNSRYTIKSCHSARETEITGLLIAPKNSVMFSSSGKSIQRKRKTTFWFRGHCVLPSGDELGDIRFALY